MLSPDRRTVLVDALKPPAGMQLDRAVGTTYSLDLEALLIAPVAFAMFDVDVGDTDALPNPIALLEAVQRYADRISLFCQAGAIGLPRNYQPIVSYLEERIHPSLPRRSHRIFHPKVWVLRFASEEDTAYRLLCLTRNLTFSRSWDTVVRLDGRPARATTKRQTTSQPLRDFITGLARLSVNPLPATEVKEIQALAEEMLRVEWELPDGVDVVEFEALGLSSRLGPRPLRGDRALLISPFLANQRIEDMALDRTTCTLVSRAESLDQIRGELLEEFEHVFVLNDAAGGSDSEPGIDSPNEGVAQAADNDLQGLHAKAYVAESGGKSVILTGSPNLTHAAVSGNVEFSVRLSGPIAKLGVNAVLGAEGIDGTLRSLLEPYRRETLEPLEESARQAALRLLDEAARMLAGVHFEARVSVQGDDLYSLTLRSDDAVPAIPDEIALACRPITLPKPADQGLGSGIPAEVAFDGLSLISLTSFFVLSLQTEADGSTIERPFVINAELIGAPADRRERILTAQLQNAGDVVRYLLFLLADVGPESNAQDLAALVDPDGSGTWRHGSEIPLFESLVRAFARNPAALDHVARLLDDLQRTPEGQALMPPGLLEVWEPIWQARMGASQ